MNNQTSAINNLLQLNNLETANQLRQNVETTGTAIATVNAEANMTRNNMVKTTSKTQVDSAQKSLGDSKQIADKSAQ
jgi:hypothetical protein